MPAAVSPAALAPPLPARTGRLGDLHLDLAAVEFRAIQAPHGLTGLPEVVISTNPKPRDRPESRSVTTLAESTPPTAANASRRRSLDVENESPPTKSLTATAHSF